MQNLSYKYSIGSSGLTELTNVSTLLPTYLVDKSINFNLINNCIESRGGSSIIIYTPTNSPIISIFGNIDTEDSILSITENGKLFFNTLLLKTFINKIQSSTFIKWNNNVIVNVGNDKPIVLDPITKIIENYPPDKMSEDWIIDGEYPSIMIVAKTVNASRGWAIGSSLRPNSIYFSKILEEEDFVPDFSTSGGGGNFIIEDEKIDKLVAIQEYGSKIIVFGNNKSAVIDTTDSDPVNWKSPLSQWYGGTISQNTVVKVENDIFILSKDGTLYALTTVNAYGDYKMASVTHLTNFDKYIYNKIKFYYSKPQLNYDPLIRAIKIFLPHANPKKNDHSLVYFIDYGKNKGWSLHNNTKFRSGYNASCSYSYFFNSEFKMLTGDYNGNIWKLEQENTIDDNEFFHVYISTPWLDLTDLRTKKRFTNGWLQLKLSKPLEVKLKLLRDGESSESKEISFVPKVERGAIFNKDKWNQCKFGPIKTDTLERYKIHKICERLQQQFEFIPFNENLAAKWNISKFNEPGSVFGYGKSNFRKFKIISNILDITSITKELKLDSNNEN